MYSKLKGQSSVIKLLLYRVKNLATLFKGSRKVLLKPAYPAQPCIAGLYNFERAEQA